MIKEGNRMIEVRQLCLDLGYSSGGLDYLIKKKKIKKEYAHNPKGTRLVVITEDDAEILINHKREFKWSDWTSAKELSKEFDMTSRELLFIAKKNDIPKKSIRRNGTKSILEICFSPENVEKLKTLLSDLSWMDGGGKLFDPRSGVWSTNHSRGLYMRIQSDYEMPLSMTEYFNKEVIL